MPVVWTSGPASKPEGLPGAAGSAGLLTDVSYTKSRQDASLDSRFWQDISSVSLYMQTANLGSLLQLCEDTVFTTIKFLTPTFLSSSPTMLSADILADVVRGVPVRPSPETKPT